MATNLETTIRSLTPSEALFLHFGRQFGRMIELKDGNLLNVSGTGATVSRDGGYTWTEPQTLLDVDGKPVGGTNPGLLRLPAGGIGMVYDRDEHRPYGMTVWFTRSDDEGRTWSAPVLASDPNNNAWYFGGAIVTSRGRIVFPVYTLIGHATKKPQKGRAFYGDRLAVVGHHDYELFISYCSAYHSDDEGQTWQANEGKGIWGAGGELIVVLDYSNGGCYSAEEPVVAEVSPNHLIMLIRTAMGRFYQSWSTDDGKSWSPPEPSTLASSQAPGSLVRIPGTDHLLFVWNQSTVDEIEGGRQRIRLSSAISKDGGATWEPGPNVVNSRQNDITYVEPPPIRRYRARERAPRVPLNDFEATYPAVSFWKDRALVVYNLRDRAYMTLDESGEKITREGTLSSACVGFPIAWFYRLLGH